MNLYSNPQQPPQRILSPSSSRSRTSSFGDGFARYRWVLYLLVGIIILIMILGLLFVAHQYYVGFGGQGWLKSREERQEHFEIYTSHLFLPLRKQEVWNAGSGKRSPQNDVPYYACGDQQNSCQTYNQPNICCPPWSMCYEASFSLSGIFCCNASVSQFECQASESHPPKCLASLVECPAAAGGGCCPKSDICSPNGCIHTSTASILGTSLNSTTMTDGSAASSSANAFSPYSGEDNVGTPITVTNTVIEAPPATSTVVKEGEMAQIETGSKGSVMSTLFVPYSSGWLLVLVALLMGLR